MTAQAALRIATTPTRAGKPRIQTHGLLRLSDFSREQFEPVVSVDSAPWKRELIQHEQLFVELCDRVSAELPAVRSLIRSGLWRSRRHWEVDARLVA